MNTYINFSFKIFEIQTWYEKHVVKSYDERRHEKVYTFGLISITYHCLLFSLQGNVRMRKEYSSLYKNIFRNI